MTTEERSTAQTTPTTDWTALAAELAATFADRAAAFDEQDTFVAENFAELRARGVLSMGIPVELGGAGLGQAGLSAFLRTLAGGCGSTALTLSMHLHLVAANVWRYRRGLPGEALLRRVAAEQLLLVSTGGRDWLSSNGEMTPVEGGYRVTAVKAFSSGAPVGDLIVTSACLDDAGAGRQVAHFAIPTSAPGVSVGDDWHTLGMRGTGSHTVRLEGVFVPEAAISLRRPAGEWHPVWATVLGVALPLIMSVYVGVAEAAASSVTDRARRGSPQGPLPYLLGELRGELTTARLALDSMVALSDGYDFEPTVEIADELLIRKTVCARAVLATVEKALEVSGGVGFYRSFGLERLLRDVHGAQFHPLPEKQQQLFSGRVALGLTPVESPRPA
ncbi:acyl-CoA dehydrogenase family protein [Deinococcus pimensis]|uniref:acyl-CoA dehydrogenase family protein n=1 Tax=Deinococcus pimensis TaxID=309888 RepID=UPI0004B16968|nr:acyl-CoA dehydrogenase family protein [Deinococcus pimensis]